MNGVLAPGLFFFFLNLPGASGFCLQASVAGFYHLFKRSPDPCTVTPSGGREPGLTHTATLSFKPLAKHCGRHTAMSPANRWGN